MQLVSGSSAVYRHRVVPLALDMSMLPSDATAMFRAWVMAYMDDTPVEQMWVPVGRIGPMVVLGHHDPESAPLPSFPLWAFGLVRIPEPTHRRLRGQLGERLSSDEDAMFEFTPLAIEVAPAKQHGFGCRAAVELMLSFPGAARDASSVRGVLSGAFGDEEALNALPAGWREAAISLAGDLAVVETSKFFPPPEVANLVPDTFAREHDIVPLAVEGRLIIAACPHANGSSRALTIGNSWKAVRDTNADNYRLSLVLCPPNARADLERRITSRNKNTVTVAPIAAAPRPAVLNNVRTKLTLNRKEFDRLSIDMPNIDDRTLLRLALYRAIESGASDLHIDTENGAGRMRVRRDNFMRPLGPGRFALSRLSALIQLLRVNIDASGGDLDPVDGKFSLRYDNSFFDVRVSILPAPDSAVSGHGYAVLRFLPKDGGVRTLTDLQMAKEELSVLLETLDKPHGIVLVTGPTGSGKTTTLNAMIQQLNKGVRPGEEGALKILTAEDPVEYTIDGVQQINVSKQIDFAEAIRRFLRQDPDVILVGEIRDRETAEAAITAARTGHLVFSTLHTNGAAETISRLLGMGLPAYDLDTLLTVVAQRLVPRLCANCKETRPLAEPEVSMFTCARVPVPAVLHEPNPNGCPHCDKGWKGRLPILEIVKVNRAVRAAISDGVPEHQLQKVCVEQGFRPLHEQALTKVAFGETSLTQAIQLHGGWD